MHKLEQIIKNKLCFHIQQVACGAKTTLSYDFFLFVVVVVELSLMMICLIKKIYKN